MDSVTVTPGYSDEELAGMIYIILRINGCLRQEDIRQILHRIGIDLSTARLSRVIKMMAERGRVSFMNTGHWHWRRICP